MKTLSRTMISGIGGLFITTGLALAMVAMIKVEFEAQRSNDIIIEPINPYVIDEDPPRRTITPVELNKIEVPPPAPRLSNQTTPRPVSGPSTLGDAIPKIEPPEIQITTASFTIPDRNAQPVLRITPPMPQRAEKSGHCKMRFNVNAQGAPYNVRAVYCSQSLFERNSIKATQKFKYRPKILNGVPMDMTGVETTILYKLADGNGRVIPE